jgi:citrate lyase subunit beta / citryl-CoA lyase
MTFPRSILFVPANRTAMFDRAWESDAQAIVFDLEDSVPADQKAAGRDAVASLRLPDGWSRPVFVRLNSCGTDAFDADIRAAASAPVSGVILPKVERAGDVRTADNALHLRERREQPLALILLVETPAGVLRLAELVDAGVDRVAAFAFGGEDYRAGIGVDALDPALADFARASIVNAAAAARVPAIDAPDLHVPDLVRLRAASRHAKALGFHAKFAIHPSQLSVIHEELAGVEDRAWATRVVEVYQRAVGEGKGSVALDGRMIDEATMKRARDILKA